MIQRSAALVTTSALLFALQACGDTGGPAAPEVVLSDSLGVIIRVYSHQEAVLPILEFSPEPVLQIGSPDGDGPEVFGRITSLMLTGTGAVVVADELAGEIRTFAASGEHLVTVGSLGEGPGEFGGSANVLRVSGDSVLIWDSRQQRVSTFVAGEFTTSWSPPGEVTLSSTLVKDGRLFGEVRSGRLGGIPPAGKVRGVVQFAFVDPDGSYTTVAEVDGHEAYVDIQQNNGQITAINLFRPPFARGAFFTTVDGTDGTTLIGGPNDRLELREWNLDGQLIAINRYPALDRPFTDLVIERAQERIIERFEEPTRQMNQELESLQQNPPEFVPAFDRLWEDDEERLWIRRLTEERVEEWLVLSVNEAEPIGRLVLPEGFALMQVRNAQMAGRWQDELDVAYVRIYRLSPS